MSQSWGEDVKMLLRNLLLVLLMHCSTSIGLADSVTGDEFLDALEVRVKTIAGQAVINDAMACALVASCECSSGICSPLIEDFNRTPTDYILSPLPIEIGNTICTQRMLDPTFIKLKDQSTEYEYYFEFYFGSIDGSLRAYPGHVTPLSLSSGKCGGYDPRIRPWYLGAVSVLKNIVVLLDTGPSMGAEWNVSEETVTLLSTAQDITLNLLSTLTKGDNVTVLTYNDSAVVGDSYLVPDGGLSTTDPQYEDLISFIRSTAASAGDKGQSNVTKALNWALPIFNSSGSETLKIIILLTDGRSPANVGELTPVVEELKGRRIFLFVYQLGNKDDTLTGIACLAGGYSEELLATVVHNPLYALTSYFSFLAKSRPNIPFWQPVYTDYDTLGQIITVAFPAISSNGQLVGVAGIDVQVAGLSAILQLQLELSLSVRSNLSSSINTSATIEHCSQASGTVGDCSSNKYVPICPRTDELHTNTSLLCCAECGGLADKSTSSSRRTAVIAASVSAAVAAVALVGVVLFCVVRHRRGALYFSPAPRKPPFEFVGDGTGPGVQPSDVRL